MLFCFSCLYICFKAVAEGGRVWFMGGEGDQHQHGISPRPLKKLALKTGPKRMAPSLTPPDSPTSRRSK